MKKRNLLALFILAFFMAPLISAFDWNFLWGSNSTGNISKETSIIDLSKTTYEPRETLLAQVTKNFIDLLKLENIEVYKDGVPRPQPVISGLKKDGDIYYYYALLPNQEGNFSILIQNTRYTSFGKETTDPIAQDFEIKRLNKPALQINPGFISVLKEEKEFSIKIMSVSGNQNVKATLKSTKETKELSLIEDIEETIKFSVLNAASGKTELEIGSYKIPVFVLGKENNTKPINQSSQKSNLLITPEKISGKVTAGENYYFKILLENLGNKTINVSFSNDLNATIRPESSSIGAGKQVSVNITIPVPKKQKEDLQGLITLSFEDKVIDIPVLFEITKNITQVEINGSATEKLDCHSIGSICNYDKEKCDGETTSSLQGPCCVGECVKKPSSNTKVYLGILLLIVLVGIGAYFYFAIKNKQKPRSSEEILKERADRFRQRMKGEEVRGDLSKS
jgi:hypothetical protein